jgi:hypothetical protein
MSWGDVGGLKEMPISFARIKPCEYRLSMTVGMLSFTFFGGAVIDPKEKSIGSTRRYIFRYQW